MDILAFCRTLKTEDWGKKVNKNWSVKDVIAHLVGWEKEVALTLAKAWETKTKPWFFKTDNYDEFNAKSVAFYREYNPDLLIKEWENWQKNLDDEISKIGENNLRTHKDFDWVFDVEGEDSHYSQHYRQIKKALEGK